MVEWNVDFKGIMLVVIPLIISMLLALLGMKYNIINISFIYDENISMFIKLSACAMFYIVSYAICIILFVNCIILYALYSYIKNILL